MSAADLRNELRELRKEHMKPVSKMPKKDVAAEIQRLKVAREETPAVAATKGAREMPAVKPVASAQDSTFEKVSGGTKKGMERKTARKAYEGLKEEKAEKAEKPKAMPKAKAAPKKAPMEKKEEKKEAAPAKKGRPAKGSEEARAHMARIRAMRGKKKEE